MGKLGGKLGKLDGKVAIVTGGGSGIGFAIARAYVAEGASVVIGEFSEERGEAAVEQLAAAAPGGATGRARFVRADVTQWEDVDRLVAETVRALGRLHVMVNNAGILDGYADCLETTAALFDKVMSVNVKGVFFGCKRALQEMAPAGYGKIVNMASMAGLQGRAGGLAYTTSKHAVIGITRQVACEFGPKGVRANAICPGVIGTQLRVHSRELLGDLAPAETGSRGLGAASDEFLRELIPLGFKGVPEDIANAALYLASPDSDYVNGHALVVDAGAVVK